MFLILIALFTITVSAHSGKTDSNGGHHDNIGGGYHYHHGYPAHQHKNGVCPYNIKNNENQNSKTEISDTKKENFDIEKIVIILIVAIFIILALISIKIYGSFLELPINAFISIMALPFLAMYGIYWCIWYFIKKILFLLPTKSPWRCEMLERYWIDIDKTNKRYIPNSNDYLGRECCEIVAESDKYTFYSYRTYNDGSGGCILRRSKEDKDKIHFFGESKKYNVIFRNYLFQADYRELYGDTPITAKNLDSGAIQHFDWLSDEKVMLVFGHCGRIHYLDCIENMYVEDDKLIIEILKDNPYNKETNSKYKIIVTRNKYGDFIPKIK